MTGGPEGDETALPHSIRPGELLAGRYRLVDLLTETGGGRFWRAHDRVLERHVALHVIDAEDELAPAMLEAARRSATILDRRFLRVLDAETVDGLCYVVNEWGSGTSLDILVAGSGPLGPRRSAWLVSEVADCVAAAHQMKVAHGRLTPENVLIDRTGGVRIIGFCVDAALHGLPSDRVWTDVSDLGGLLYCALTGKWAGVSSSAVPRAPSEHGRVLRPRRVRAGIPRPLDALCDEVLHPHGSGRSRDLVAATSARGIADYLADFVGDPTGMPEALVASTPKLRPGDEIVVLPALPDMPVRDAAPLPTAPEPDLPAVEVPSGDDPTGVEDESPPPVESAVDELPTQAGLPIFGQEDDDVSWHQARTTIPPPPPPFEEPPERPLFAPTPPDGNPARRPREGALPSGHRGPDDYWPWDTSSGTDTGRGTGTGAGLTAVDEEVPGRSWLRLAAGIAVGLLLLVAIVVAYNLGRGKTVLGTEPEDDSPTTPPATSAPPDKPAEPLTGLVATDLDPQGDPPTENAEDAALAVDGDPATSWGTENYFDQFGPSGLKTGVGLTIDLGATRDVSSVELQLGGSPTDVTLYLADTEPQAVAGLDEVASETATSEELTFDLESPTSGRYLVVWLTSLPQTGAGFRGEIADVKVLGE